MPTRTLGFSALSTAIYTRLTTHAKTSSYRVFGEYVPREDPNIDTSWPYISFGYPEGVRSVGFTTRDTEAEDNAINIHVWSRAKGAKECEDMMNNVMIAISSSSLSIAGYDAPYLALLDFSDVITEDKEAQQRVFHGVIRYRFEMAPAD